MIGAAHDRDPPRVFGYTVRVLTEYAAGGRSRADGPHRGLPLLVEGRIPPSGTMDFVTANELHLPAGMRVRLLLMPAT